MTAALEGLIGQKHVAADLHPREISCTHFTGGWVGHRAVMDRRNISYPPGFDAGL